jgi:hypothetical protein
MISFFFAHNFDDSVLSAEENNPTTLVESTLLFDQSFEILMCCSSTLNSEAFGGYPKGVVICS